MDGFRHVYAVNTCKTFSSQRHIQYNSIKIQMCAQNKEVYVALSSLSLSGDVNKFIKHDKP